MKVRYAEHKVGDRRGISHASYFKVAPYRFHGCLAVKVAGFYAEIVVGEFPHIEAQADYHG